MRVPYVLFGHKPRGKFHYFSYYSTWKKSSDPVSSLDDDIRTQLLTGYEFTDNDIVSLEYFQLLEEACYSSITELKSFFGKKVPDRDALLDFDASECPTKETFETLGIHEAHGSERTFQLVIVVHLRSNATLSMTPIEADKDKEIELEINGIGRDAVVERARLRPSPSTGSKNSYVIGVQKPDQLDALYNSMPSDLAPSPIAIYCPPFATMKADLKKPSNSFDFTPDQIRMAKKLIGVSSDLYSNEKKRQEALNGLNMFGQEDFWVSATLKVYKSVVRPDGGGLSALLGHPWFPFPINRDLGEVKTDQEGGCNPIQQGANVYKKVWSKPENDEMRRASCCPALLFGVSGNVIDVWGAVFAERFFLEPIALVRLGAAQGGGGGRMSGLEEAIHDVAKLLLVISNAQAQIKDYYWKVLRPPPRKNTSVIRTVTDRKVRNTGPKCASTDRKLPSIEGKRTSTAGKRTSTGQKQGGTVGKRASATIEEERPGVVLSSSDVDACRNPEDPGQFPMWKGFSSSPGSEITHSIEYESRLTGHFNKPVYIATMTELGVQPPQKVVVKFTNRYCEAAHRLLAEHGLAPKLYYAAFESPSTGGPGMMVVVMDLIEDAKENLESGNAKQRKKLGDAMSLLHDNNFVFGDLRDPNVLLHEDDNLYLIDFDWGGVVGTVKYPVDICEDADMDWHPDVVGGGLIEVEHDKYRAKRLAAMMKG